MARGGRRQGQPGQSYQNRTDLNVDRAPMPGSSADNVSASGNPPVGPPALSPDSIPNLEEPTQFPDEPVTAGLPFGPGPGSVSVAPADLSNTLILAALRRNPDNPDLQRIVAYMNMRGNG